MTSQVDTQVTERLGRNVLIANLMQAGLEVAEPIRDRGIDLLIYTDRDQFSALPIQLKVATAESFGLYKKYEKIPGLVIAHVWHTLGPSIMEIYALTYHQSRKVCDVMGYTKTDSWREHGGYSTRHISPKLRDLLAPYRIETPEQWRRLLDGKPSISRSRPSGA